MLTKRAALLVILLACSSSSKADDPPHPAFYALGICNRLARCSPNAVRSEFGDTSTCANRYAPEVTRLLALAGVRLTRTQANDCILATEDADCTLDVEAIPACDFKGARADGAPCESGIQCASGSCTTANDAAACGQCAKRAGIGQACGATSVCEPGVDCAGGVCTARTTTAADPCVTLQCSNAECGSDSCQPFAENGEACGPTRACAFPLVCNANVCAPVVGCGTK